MPNYELNRLSEKEFERMCQSLLKAVIGNGTITFGEGPDGGREATFTGQAPYPSRTDQWNGEWIFQVKFHNTELLGTEEARKQVLKDLESELNKIINKNKYICNNYILITNVPLSSVNKHGTHDRVANEIVPKFVDKVAHIHVWGADDINRFLENYPSVRQAYLHFLTSGDLVAELMSRHTNTNNHLALIIKHFMTTSFRIDQYTQLDQAGKVDDDALLLRNVFIDLDVQIQYTEDSKSLNIREFLGNKRNKHESSMQLLLSEKISKVVLVGGPGEGKSTLGQFLAQIHRATLLGKLHELLQSDEYKLNWTPLVPRIPFRILLKDYAQWLTEGNSEKVLEFYLCEQVYKLAGEEISIKDIRWIFQENPCLLVLDGLDEVMEQHLRALMTERIAEFLDRCEYVLAANTQVLATTRPMGYSNQFDPEKFVHLVLVQLKAPKIHEYVSKWSLAKRLDSDRAKNLATIITECLEDPRISFLMRTPLQVSIFILIIQTGGTPPKQREELFNEYLEIIYRREKAKSKMIIRTKKDLLFGLHEYLGYILHIGSISVKDTNSALRRSDFINHVTKFLMFKNPQWSSDVLEKYVNMIVQEASERLVLIVGLPNETYGFELRTFQEFFAAIYLVNAKNSEQRFRRFEAIACPPHWRNVALFFAGRVGRIHSAEAAMLLEVCRDLDRREPDKWLRRGEALALELAVEQSFGSNGKLQRSAIEYSLSLIDVEPNDEKFEKIHSKLKELPNEDIYDHVLPVLKDRARFLPRPYSESAIYLYYEVGPRDNSLLDIISHFFQSDNVNSSLFAVSLCLKWKISVSWVLPYLRQTLSVTPPEVIFHLLSKECLNDPFYIQEYINSLKLNNNQLTLLFSCILSEYKSLSDINEKYSNTIKMNNMSLNLSNFINQFFCAIHILNILCNEYPNERMHKNDQLTQGIDFFQMETPLSIREEILYYIKPLIEYLDNLDKGIALDIPQLAFILELCRWLFCFLTKKNIFELIASFSSFYSEAKMQYPWFCPFLQSHGDIIHPFLPVMIEAIDMNMPAIINEKDLFKLFADSNSDQIYTLIYNFSETAKDLFSRDQIIIFIMTGKFPDESIKKKFETNQKLLITINPKILTYLISERTSYLMSPAPLPIEHVTVQLVLEEILRHVKNNINVKRQIFNIRRLSYFPWNTSKQVLHVAKSLIFTLVEQSKSNPKLGPSIFNLLLKLLDMGPLPKEFLTPILKGIAAINIDNDPEKFYAFELQNYELILPQLESFLLHTDIKSVRGAAKVINFMSVLLSSHQAGDQKQALRLSISLEMTFKLIQENDIELRCLGINLLNILSFPIESNSKVLLNSIIDCRDGREAKAWKRLLIKQKFIYQDHSNLILLFKKILREKKLLNQKITNELLDVFSEIITYSPVESLLDEKALGLPFNNE